MDPSHRAIFVIGNPRSGTTLLRLILASHSKISIPPECGFIVWLHEKYRNWRPNDSRSPGERERFVVDLLGCKKFETWKLDGRTIREAIERECPTNYAELCSLVYMAYAAANGRSIEYWGDKNNFHINHLDLLDTLFPHARFVHIVRDGRDVACSYREVMASSSDSPYFPKLATDIGAIASEWSSNVLKVDAFLARIPPARSWTVRYEDLVGHPEQATQELCAWLGLTFEPEMMSYYDKNLTDRTEPAATIGWKMRTLEPISMKTVGRYRQLLRESEVAVFDEAAYRALTAFGYR